MNFDIAALDTRTLSEAGVAMPINNPRSGAPMLGKDGKPVTITLYGPNSEIFRLKNRELSARRADFAAKGVARTEVDMERERYDLLVAVTLGWSFDAVDNQPFLFSPENVRKFWADKRWEWVQFQAWQFCQQDGNYLPNS